MDTKSLIFQKSKVLFAQDGFKATSMSSIAKACSKNKATLYHYYKSKEILYNEVLEVYLNDLQSNIRYGTTSLVEAKEKIRAYITTLIEQDSDILRIINRQILDGNSYLTDKNLINLQNIQKNFDAIFKLGISSGEFKMMSPKNIYYFIFGSCSCYLFMHHKNSDSTEEDRLFINELFSIIMLFIKE